MRDFELSPAALPAAPKWGRACSWTPRDDAMLLLGVYRYGIDKWDRCACWAAVMLVQSTAGDGHHINQSQSEVRLSMSSPHSVVLTHVEPDVSVSRAATGGALPLWKMPVEPGNMAGNHPVYAAACVHPRF